MQNSHALQQTNLVRQIEELTRHRDHQYVTEKSLRIEIDRLEEENRAAEEGFQEQMKFI
jgi:hypothetical protein